MAVIAVHDYDYFHYTKVIPNLECAKIVTYHRRHNDIAVLSPALAPEKYSKFIIRKEYDDGYFPKQFFYNGVEYGGKVFNPNKYVPLAPAIENTIPDMHIYDEYISHFGSKNSDLIQIKRILNCAHMRLAPDSENILSVEKLKKNFETKVTGIFLHDYDLASLHAYDTILALQNMRYFVTKEGINPYPVGNKYPIRIKDSKELDRWKDIVVIPNAFFLEYLGLMDDTTLYNLCVDNSRMARQVYYNIGYGCSSEDDFLMNRLPKIFIQCLFLRRAGVKILLNYDDDFKISYELERFIELLNCWLSFQWMEDFLPVVQTLFHFCRNNSKLHYTNWAFMNVTVSIEDIRKSFQYIRERNYPLFSWFYTIESVDFKGGKFIPHEWT